MLRRSSVHLGCLLCLCIGGRGQEATTAISIPITVSGDVRATTAPSGDDDGTNPAAGFRAVLSPTVQLTRHWFLYAALEAHSSNYFAYPTGSYDDGPVQFQVMQAFAGYTSTLSKASILIKAGQLSSAFGTFPVEYDDAKMPLIDAPPLYTTTLPLRPDQLPCGVNDVIGQSYGSEIEDHCGGSVRERYGLTPVALYGLPAFEAEVAISRVDARLQLTNSSPASPQALTSDSQHLEWTAGGGYALRGGLHIGASAFWGPYLDRNLDPILPAGTSVRDFVASGKGIDAEWSKGRWSIAGEWQHFRFGLPGFLVSPAEDAGYGQIKRIISPRIYLSARATAEHFGRIQDNHGASANQFEGPLQIYEMTFGYRLNRQQLLKIGSSWTDHNYWEVNRWSWPQATGYTFEAQLVTSVTTVSKIFR
jgi:hypothetical protein